MNKFDRTRRGLMIGGFTLVVFAMLFAMISCAAKQPIDKAKIGEDIFIKALEKAAATMPVIESQFPDKVGEVKKVFMQLKKAVQEYQDAMVFWSVTGDKPLNYDKIVASMIKILSDFKPLMKSVGVELK